MIKIQCSWPECENHGKECWRCCFNASLRLGNYLILKNKDGKTVRYLETSSSD